MAKRMERGPRPGFTGGPAQRINEMIRIAQVRVISEEGEQLGVMSSQDALAKARAAGLDLVEVASDAKPPVCRIMDYGKYKYEQKKRASKQQSNKQQIKELRLHTKTGAADVQVKVNKAREFLDKDKDKVIVSIVFRGREMAHTDEGQRFLQSFIDQLLDVARVEAPPKLIGKRMSCTLAPLSMTKSEPKKNPAPEKGKKNKTKATDDSDKVDGASDPNPSAEQAQ